MVSKKFIRNSFLYTIAGTLPLASGIILLPIYLTYLSTPVYGALTLYMGLALLVQIFVTYSFDSSVYSYFHDYKHDPEKLNVFVSSVFTFILLVGLATSVAFFFLGSWIFEKVFTDNRILFYPYGIISIVSGIFQAVFKVNSSLLQTQEKAGAFFFQNLISFSLIASFTIIGLRIYPNELIGPVTGRLLAIGISSLWVLFNIYRKFGFHFNFDLIRGTFEFNHPLLIYQLMQWVNSTFDRFILQPFTSLAVVGIYDIAAKCLQAIDFVLVGFHQSFYPRVLGITVLQKEKKSTIEINRYYNGLTAVAILLVTLSIFAMPIVLDFLVQWLNRPEYAEVIHWIPFIAVTYLLRSIRFYISMPYASLKYAKPLPFFYLIIVSVKILGMILLIPRLGIQGVIISTWLGYAVEILILYFGVRNKFALEFNVFKLVVAPLGMAVAIIVIEPLWGSNYPLFVHGSYILIGLGLLLWAYQNELKPAYFKLK